MLDITEIEKLIPHRYPFLLLDRIVEVEEQKRIIGMKNVTVNEPFFQGHFPERPIMPGVLIIEAMAQAGAILAALSEGRAVGKVVYFTGIDKAKFRKIVVPGDQLRIEVEALRHRTKFWKFRGYAYVDQTLAAEAEIQAMLADSE